MASGLVVAFLVLGVAVAQATTVIVSARLLERLPTPVVLVWIRMTFYGVLGAPTWLSMLQQWWRKGRLAVKASDLDGLLDDESTSAPSAINTNEQEEGTAVSSDEPHPIEVAPWWKLLFFYGISATANVTFITSLTGLDPAVAASIFATSPAFVCVLSFVWASRPFSIIESLAAVGSVAGMVVSTHPWAPSHHKSHHHTPVIAAIVCGLVAPALAAVYNVAFAKFFRGASRTQVALFISKLSAVSLFFGLPLLIICIAVGWIESPIATLFTLPDGEESAENLKWVWGLLIGSCFSGLAFNFLVQYAITVTYPLLVSVATIFSAVLAGAFSAIVDDVVPSTLHIIGFVMIVLSFSALFVKERCLKKPSE